MFWKKNGIDHSAPESRTIEVGMAIIEQTAKRRKTSLHLQEIVRALFVTVGGSNTGWKFTLRDLARMKFRGVRYVDQDGFLINVERAERLESKKDYASMGDVPPPVTAGMIWDGEREPTASHNGGIESEGVSRGNCDASQPAELLPADFFTDPSIFFFGPSSSGFTGIGDQWIAGETTTYLPRSL